MPKGLKSAPKKQPGAQAMDKALQIGGEIAKVLPTHRACSIQITNKCSSYILSKPCVHMTSGQCVEVLPPTVDGASTAKALFSKTADTARGAVGVLTYELLHKSTSESTKKMAVMFSVPYDFNLFSNWFAVGIFDKSTECDGPLFHRMYNNTEADFTRKKGGNCLEHKSHQFTISATMSNSYQPDMKVEVIDG